MGMVFTPGTAPLGGLVIVGVDENGLGPRLGPLIVTSVEARAVNGASTAAAIRLACSKPRGKLRERLGDSKELVSYGDSSLGEAWARAFIPDAQNPPDLLAILLADTPESLRSFCPQDHVGQCWDGANETFRADKATVAEVREDLDRLASKGLRIERVRVALVCAKVINDRAAKGLTRFEVDLHTMEKLVLAIRADAGEDVTAICGKVGGYDRYSASFGPLSGRLHAIVEEGRARSTYKFPGVGEIHFVRDADRANMLVSLASLVGKWTRDLVMSRIVRYHRAEDPTLPNASGYHDPISTRFIDSSRLNRKRRGVPDECFERNKVSEGPRSDRAASRASRPS
jgi:ribonuclease HII